MKRAFVLPVAAFLCLATTPALAQKKPNLDGENVLTKFAQCVVRAVPRQSGMLIDTAPGSEEERAQILLLLQKQRECFKMEPSIAGQALGAQVNLGLLRPAQVVSEQRQMKFPSSAFRGAIAAQLYLGLVNMKSPISTLSAPSDNLDAGLPVGYAVVRCAVARDPISADRLVRSKRLSAVEADAGRAFAPALNGCAQGRGRVDISGTMIHGWAAEALYKQHRLDSTGER